MKVCAELYEGIPKIMCSKPPHTLTTLGSGDARKELLSCKQRLYVVSVALVVIFFIQNGKSSIFLISGNQVTIVTLIIECRHLPAVLVFTYLKASEQFSTSYYS